MSRKYTPIATTEVQKQLKQLLESIGEPKEYQSTMTELGRLLGESVFYKLNKLSNKDTIVVSTAEDADFLQYGVASVLKRHDVNIKLAIFWNHHYQLPNKASVAPILHSFIESNYEDVKNVVIVKSVMSGSCVVRTNLIAMLDKIKDIENIFILSPVAHKDSKKKLKEAFPKEISDKFVFIFFAEDDVKNEEGEVIPGIGGQIYNLLGLDNQPALTGYMPKVIKEIAFKNLDYS